MVGVAPLLGGAMLAYIFIKAFITYKNPAETETGTAFLGFGVPVAIGVGLILLGVVVMIWANFAYPKFFKRKPEVADPGILEGTVVGRSLGAGRLSAERRADERDHRWLRRIGLRAGGAGGGLQRWPRSWATRS